MLVGTSRQPKCCLGVREVEMFTRAFRDLLDRLAWEIEEEGTVTPDVAPGTAPRRPDADGLTANGDDHDEPLT